MKFTKKITILAIAISLSAGALAAANGSSPNGKPFVAIEDQVYEIKGEVSSLQDQIDSIVADVDTIEQRLTANEDAITALQVSNTSLQVLVDNNISSTEDINTTISILESELLELQGNMDANADAIAAQEALIASLQSAILEVENGLISLDADLQSQIDHNNLLISTLETEVDQINMTLEEKQNIINGVCPSGSAIYQITEDGNVACEAVGGNSSISRVTVQAYQPVPANSSYGALVDCPTGYTQTGGGYVAHYAPNVFFTRTAPNGNGWWVIARNQNSFDTYYFVMLTCIRIIQS